MTNLNERDKKMLLHGFSMAGTLARRYIPDTRCYDHLVQFANNLSQAWGIDAVSDVATAEYLDIANQANQAMIDAGRVKGPNPMASKWWEILFGPVRR